MRAYRSPFEFISARTVAPTVAPVSLPEAKAHLQIDDNDEDGLILALIDAVTEHFDGANGALGKALITQTWTVSVKRPEDNSIILPVTPVQSVSSIAYYDGDDNSQTLTVSDFYLYKTEDFAYITPKQGVTWPVTRNREDAFTVTYVAGFGGAADVPQIIKQAILLMLRHWFDNRSATSDLTIKDVPLAVEAIVNRHKKGWVA